MFMYFLKNIDTHKFLKDYRHVYNFKYETDFFKDEKFSSKMYAKAFADKKEAKEVALGIYYKGSGDTLKIVKG